MEEIQIQVCYTNDGNKKIVDEDCMREEFEAELAKAKSEIEQGIINHPCHICGNVSGYDKESLKASTRVINGIEIVLCCNCEDDLKAQLITEIESDDIENVAKKNDMGSVSLTVILNSLSKEILREKD